MKNIFTIAFMLVCTTLSAQDTLCVMVCLDEIIHFDYKKSEILYRYDHKDEIEIKVKEGEVLCLHLCDEKKRYRDVTTNFTDGTHTHNTLLSKDNVIYTRESWGDLSVTISKARKKQNFIL